MSVKISIHGFIEVSITEARGETGKKEEENASFFFHFYCFKTTTIVRNKKEVIFRNKSPPL